MIPKIIHYCWLSGDPYPENIQKCIDSWKKVLPDYEIILWDTKRFDLSSSLWVSQAFEKRKYAFAADYIRMYALYNYGGIYLDSDVEVLKPFDDLLDLPYFLGQENTTSGIEAAVIGSEKGWILAKQMLDRYSSKSFLGEDGYLDTRPMPYLMRWCIESNFSYKLISNKDEFDLDQRTVCVFPVDYFSPKEWYTRKITITPNTYSIHHFASSWMDSPKITTKSWKVKLKERFVMAYRRTCSSYLRDVAILSNQSISKSYYDYFFQPHNTPIQSTKLYGEDFLRLLDLLSSKEDLKLSFIPHSLSKHTASQNDFYPIALVEDTDIEIHFIHTLTKQEAIADWNEGMRNMKGLRKVVAYISLGTAEDDKIYNSISLPKFKLSSEDDCLKDLRPGNCDTYNWRKIRIMSTMRKKIRNTLKSYSSKQ